MGKFTRFKFQPCIPIGDDGRKITGSHGHVMLSREAASEGMVLLKNDNSTLPLKNGEKIALFGKSTFDFLFSGGGSGECYSIGTQNVYDGFCEKQAQGKVVIYQKTSDFYRDYVASERRRIQSENLFGKHGKEIWSMPCSVEREEKSQWLYLNTTIPEPDVSEMAAEASEFADTAIITLGRFSSEGVDRFPVKGDYYLTDAEEKLISDVSKVFKKTVIILNICGVIDMENFADNKNVSAVLVAWQPGMAGGAAIADILCGDVTPSGKLADTFAKSHVFYPSNDDFTHEYYKLKFHEDIYVGYRYFETIPGADKKVRYPFGYGLSYTTFSFENIFAHESNGKVIVALTVKNTGSYSGKEVIQVYYDAPQGKLGKPALQLAAFRKTKLLAPGEEETVALSFEVKSMASYDDLGKIQKSAYVLEKGDYHIYVGNSVRNLKKADYVYTAESDIITEQLTSRCVPFELDKRMLSDGTFEELSMGEKSVYYGENSSLGGKAPEKVVSFEKVGEEISLDDFIAQMTDDELCEMVGGSENTGVADTSCFGKNKRLSVPSVPTADGPAGLRIRPDREIPTTTWPCATLLACSFNEDLIYRVGKAGAKEVKENNIGVWLTPALNIHRSPLCGRNFEYFSEDPLLSGKMAAAEIRGIQSEKIAVSAKHFAANSKETDRFNCDSIVSERALREIYLKGFEICVKEADPWTIMSSYNLLNGTHTSESYDLLTGILRDEWSFGGMVTTDWGIKNNPVNEVKAGNDVKMPFGYANELKQALADGNLKRADLEACVKRILSLFLKFE